MREKMKVMPHNTTDEQLIDIVDGWAACLEAGDYQGAFDSTGHVAEMEWTPEKIRFVIENYGDAIPGQTVTVAGKSTDVSQRKEVDRWEPNSTGEIGEVWYDLNINGVVSDLTATFFICKDQENLTLRLNDIHVM